MPHNGRPDRLLLFSILWVHLVLESSASFGADNVHPNTVYSPISSQVLSQLYAQLSGQMTYPQPVEDGSSFATLKQSVKRSQEIDKHGPSSVAQLSNSMTAATSATSGVSSSQSYDSPSTEQNYTLVDSDYYQPSSVYSNYYVNPQQYTYAPVDSTSGGNSATGPYAFPPSVLEQYASLLQHSNQSNHSKHKNNKQTGLGRRIGELVTNSAERASRAFKSFSQFKLFNDIKPSRLLGLVGSDQQQSVDPKAINSSMAPASGSPSGAWYYYSSPMNPWSSFVPPSPSSVFFQQPVFVRTPEMTASAAAASVAPVPSVGPLNSSPMGPSAVSPGSQTLPMHGSKSSSASDNYMSPISDFYSPKLSMDNSPLYQPTVTSGQSNSQYSSSVSNPSVPVGTSTTTVYHHFAGESNQNSASNSNTNNNNQQDLFASPQTQFGLRVKPPKDFEFDGSNEEDLQSGEQDDAKMANGERNSDRNSVNNDVSTNNEMSSHTPSGTQSQWSGGNAPFDEFPDQNNAMEPEMFGPNSFAANNRHQFSRPYLNSDRPRESFDRGPLRPMSNLRPFGSGLRRPPTPMPLEFDEPDNWYNTFFGSSVKPMSRLRPFAFNSGPMSFMPPSAIHGQHAHHHQANPSLLSSAASTSTSTALSPDSYLSPFMGAPMRPDSANYFAYGGPTAAARPPWPYGPLYSQPTSSPFFRPSALLSSAATSVRPVTIPYFPANSNYFVPRFARTQPMYGPYPTAFPGNAHQASAGATPTGPPMMASNPYLMARYPYPMMSAAGSSLYPVRMPFSPMVPMSASVPFGVQPMGSTILPAMATSPIMRYRYGPDLTQSASRRAINITKRAQTTATEFSAAIPRYNGLSSVNEANQAESRNLESSEDSLTPAQSNAIVPNKEEQNLATLYNAYQVLQRRMDTEHSSSTNNVDKSGQPQQQQYQYYIGKETTTATNATTNPTTHSSIDLTEQSVNLTNLSPSVKEFSIGRSIKARHVSDQLEEPSKTQEQIRKYLEKPLAKINKDNDKNNFLQTVDSISLSLVNNTSSAKNSTFGRALQVESTDQWRPLLRVESTRKRH